MEVEYLGDPHKKKYAGKKPTVIPWKDTTMIRDHSIRAVAHEIMNMSSNQDLISVNVIGKQSTGKTELCKTIAHLVHQMDEEDWDVNIIGKKEFLNLEETVKDFKPMNNIVIFDDIAFLKAGASQQQIEQIQFILSVIRHLPGGKDVRIIIFKSFQYSKALPPFLRQNDVSFISSVDDAELKSMEDMIGNSNMDKIKLLKKMGVQLKMGSKNQSYFDYPLGGRKGKKNDMYFTYHAKHPFLPYVYYNGLTARIIVSPLRTWIDPVCPVCDKFGEHEQAELEQNYEQFKKEFDEKYGGTMNIAKLIIRASMLKRGVNCFSNSVVAGMKKLEKFISTHPTEIEKLMTDYNLKPTQTRIDKDTGNVGKKPLEEVNPLKKVDDT